MEDMNNENRENFSENSNSVDENEFAYKTVIQGKQNSRLFSVLSVVFSALSFILSFAPWVSFISGALGILFAIISRKNLGYFDNLSLAGLIVGIFGTVFSAMGILISLFLKSDTFKSIIEAIIGTSSSGSGNIPGDGYYV